MIKKPKERTIFNEIEDTKRLIDDHRNTLYMLQDTDADSQILHDREIIVKGLELYQQVLEQTVNTMSRSSTPSRKKSGS